MAGAERWLASQNLTGGRALRASDSVLGADENRSPMVAAKPQSAARQPAQPRRAPPGAIVTDNQVNLVVAGLHAVLQFAKRMCLMRTTNICSATPDHWSLEPLHKFWNELTCFIRQKLLRAWLQRQFRKRVRSGPARCSAAGMSGCTKPTTTSTSWHRTLRSHLTRPPFWWLDIRLTASLVSERGRVRPGNR